MSQSYSLPDFSHAEKSYKVASIARDHLASGIIVALGSIESAQRVTPAVPWELGEWLRRARRDLEFALDAAEGER